MKFKQECKIVRDLLPNYIENLLNEETKNFVTNHINNCTECKEIFQKLKKDVIQENDISYSEQQIELNYLKKYNRKFFLLKCILFFIIAIILILLTIITVKYNYNNSIITTSCNKFEELKNTNNFYLKVHQYRIDYKQNTESNYTTTYYYKDEKLKTDNKGNSTIPNYVPNDYICFEEIGSHERTEIYENRKEIVKLTYNYDINLKSQCLKEIFTNINNYGKINWGFLGNISIKTSINIKSNKYNGNDCYILELTNDKNGFKEIWINKETMLPIREIEYIKDISYYEKTFSFKTDIVTEDNISLPNLEDYSIKNKIETVNEDLLKYYSIDKEVYGQ